jgi:hypothetical protein
LLQNYFKQPMEAEKIVLACLQGNVDNVIKFLKGDFDINMLDLMVCLFVYM